MLLIAHIAGIPVEETALSFSPVAGMAVGMVGMRVRHLLPWPRGRRETGAANSQPEGGGAFPSHRTEEGGDAGGTR